MVLLTPKEHADEILEQVVAGSDGRVISGASRLPNDTGLIFKVLAVLAAEEEVRSGPARHGTIKGGAAEGKDSIAKAKG